MKQFHIFKLLLVENENFYEYLNFIEKIKFYFWNNFATFANILLF